jgi:hypothetical protein
MPGQDEPRRPTQTIDLSEAMAFLPELEAAQAAVEEMVPNLAEARRAYATSRSETDRRRLDQVQEAASARMTALENLLARAQAAIGLPPELFAEMETADLRGDRTDRRHRATLTADQVEPTACVDDSLAQALNAVVARLPSGWLEQEPADLFRLPDTIVDRPFSIVKGFRPESERPSGHRLRQMVQVARDRLAENPRYDHLAGALLVPQLTRLGMRLELLDTIPGAAARIENLWKKPAEVDNTVLELLVAAGLAERGRRPSFIPEGQSKTPDIRCEDPFPLVVECKRRNALSDYELEEEAAMRGLFLGIEAEARERGLTGVFELTLSVEHKGLDIEAITARCMQQRLHRYPHRPQQYDWGSVAFRRIPPSIGLPGATKAYSPELLEYCFDWNPDLPQHDGLICRAVGAEGVMVDEVRGAIALAWTNVDKVVAEKRSRPPTSLFGKATNQVPGGEFAIVYICYPEGAREEIADRRMQEIASRLQEWEHSASFRIPVVYISRLYPRALKGGAPDLIESTMSFLSEVSGGDPWMLEKYPSCVFTLDERE